jgi:hypothetical protein
MSGRKPFAVYIGKGLAFIRFETEGRQGTDLVWCATCFNVHVSARDFIFNYRMPLESSTHAGGNAIGLRSSCNLCRGCLTPLFPGCVQVGSPSTAYGICLKN